MPDRSEMFIEYYCNTGNATQAAIIAGYSEKTAKQKGYELKNKFGKEIDERNKKLMRELVPSSLAALRHLVSDAESEAVRLGAVKDVLDRSGMKPVDKVETTTIEQKSTDELLRELEQLRKH